VNSTSLAVSPSIQPEVPFDIKSPIGILDPEGNAPNPLTGRPYENLYATDGKDNKTYADWSAAWVGLAVYKRREDLLQTMRDHQIVVARSGTGTGKTVLFPKLALHVCGYKQKVICAVPKKIVASGHAKYASKLLDVELGKQVGYRYKNSPRDAHSAKHTMLAFATTGTVTALLQNDPKLSQYGYLVIDEAHERSMGMDKLLSLVKELVQLRSDIRIIIMSATIDLDMYKRFLPSPKYDMACVDVKGDPPFPRELVFRDKPLKNGDTRAGMIQGIVDQVMHILRTKPLQADQRIRRNIVRSIRKNKPHITHPEDIIRDGDIIVFVPSASYATDICKQVEDKRRREGLENLMCLRLDSNSEAEKVHTAAGALFLDANGTVVSAERLATDESLYHSHPDNDPKDPFKRKLVVSTNVAESSVTIDGATYVIDTAIGFSSFFQHQSQLTEMKLFRVAQDAVMQRQGRVGRTSPGIAYHLYTQAEFNAFNKMTTPDFQKEDLSADVLGILSMPGKDRVQAVRNFYNEMLEPPKEELFQSACRVLRGSSAITMLRDPYSGTLTPNNDTRTMLGRAMSLFRGSFSVAQAKSLVLSEFYDCSREMAHICAMLQSCQGKPFATKLMETQKNECTAHPVPMRFVSQYGDHLTLLHIYQHYHYAGQRHTDTGAIEEAKRAFCRRHKMKPKFLESVEALSDTIHRTLREKVFDNPDQTLLNLTDGDVLGDEALKNIRTNPLTAAVATTSKFYKGRAPTQHKRAGSFAVSADYASLTDVNTSGKLDVEVLYKLFPTTNRDLKAILKHITADRQIALTSTEHARELLSEYISEYKPRVFRKLSLQQQQAVVTALERSIRHRTVEGAAAQERAAAADTDITSQEAASEARGHEHWLQNLKVFAKKASERVEQRLRAAEAHAERKVRRQKAREVIGKRHLYPPPTDYFSPEWSNVEHRVLRALFEGHVTQIAVKVGAGRYRTTFPEKKVVATIDMGSVLTSTYWKSMELLQSHDVVVYDTVTTANSKTTMQNVSVLPTRARYDVAVQHMITQVAGKDWRNQGTQNTKSDHSQKRHTGEATGKATDVTKKRGTPFDQKASSQHTTQKRRASIVQKTALRERPAAIPSPSTAKARFRTKQPHRSKHHHHYQHSEKKTRSRAPPTSPSPPGHKRLRKATAKAMVATRRSLP
jgi:HrpA-like RNA helicase